MRGERGSISLATLIRGGKAGTKKIEQESRGGHTSLFFCRKKTPRSSTEKEHPSSMRIKKREDHKTRRLEQKKGTFSNGRSVYYISAEARCGITKKKGLLPISLWTRRESLRERRKVACLRADREGCPIEKATRKVSMSATRNRS